uniref:Uncharacterized protein n=1 Tax=Pyxicephalus adspersus TaxID=30357 RepID=A0AAV3AJX0_PYXAD|nr:TPA: hypothetical protein GDO54_007537 [Pyxicephalus adspersus]
MQDCLFNFTLIPSMGSVVVGILAATIYIYTPGVLSSYMGHSTCLVSALEAEGESRGGLVFSNPHRELE